MISIRFLITALVVVLVLGAGVINTLATGLGRGARALLWAALGCVFGIVPAMAAAILGLAAVLHALALAFQLAKFAGLAGRLVLERP